MRNKAMNSAAIIAAIVGVLAAASCSEDIPETNAVDGTTRINTTYSPQDGPYKPRHGGGSLKPYTPDPSVRTPERIYLYWLDEKEIVYYNDDEMILIGRTFCDNLVAEPTLTTAATTFTNNLTPEQKTDLAELSKTHLCH